MTFASGIADRTLALRRRLGLTGRVCIAYSGGLDSSVLLHALARRGELDLAAVYVDHGLAADGAGWRAHVEAFAAGLDVPLTVIPVTVAAAAGDSVEARARAARYQAFAQVMRPGDAMLTAQHASDQAETLLLQLLRGAGVAGLAAMPAFTPLGTGWCLRPMLTSDRPEIEAYARAHGVRWHDDPSNADTRFSRNYLRLEVLPALRGRWPALSKTLSRSAALQGEAHALLNQLAAADARAVSASRVRVPIGGLATLAPERQRNLLRFLLAARDFPAPPQRRMASILKLAGAARSGKVAWGGVAVRRYRDTLYLLDALPDAPAAGEHLRLRPGVPARLPAGLGAYACVARPGMTPPPADALTVGFREGGERVRPSGGLRTTPLSKWFQARGIPPWARRRMPLLSCDDEIVAVGDTWVDTGSPLARSCRVEWTGHPVMY